MSGSAPASAQHRSAWPRNEADGRPANDPYEVVLSWREGQILRHLRDGSPNKAIARDLQITEATVKVHVKSLLRKTRALNRTQAAIWAKNNPYKVVNPDDAQKPRSSHQLTPL